MFMRPAKKILIDPTSPPHQYNFVGGIPPIKICRIGTPPLISEKDNRIIIFKQNYLYF